MQLNVARGRIDRRPAFVNRTAELEQLEHELFASVGGELRVVSVVGDPGIGKSRLLAEFRNRAALDVWMTTACLSYAPAPLAPIADLLRELVARDASLVPADERTRAVLAALLPELGRAERAETDNEELERRRLFAAVAHVVAEAAQRARPLVLTIEDLQWADGATLALVRYVAEHVDAPLLLLLTYRAEALVESGPFRAAIAELQRNDAHRRIALGALPPTDAQRLARAVAAARGGVSDAELDAICRRSDGHPLFLTELVQAASENGGRRPTAIPLTVDEIMRARVERLEAPDIALLEVAALLGRRFDPHVLALVASLGADDIDRALRAARAAWIVVESERRGLLEFRHELLRDALCARLTPAGARAVHQRILDVLAALPDADDRFAELANHALEAGDTERARQYAEAAGDRAAALHAHDEAATAFTRALGLGRLDPLGAARLHEKAGNARYYLGELVDARSHFEAARRAVLDPAVRARLLLALARTAFRTADVVTARAQAEEAWAILEPLPPTPLHADALVHNADYVAHTDAAAALRYLELADGFGAGASPRLAPRYFHARAWTRFLLGDVDAWKADVARYVEAAAATGDPATIVASATNLASCAIELGELDLAVHHLGPAVELGASAKLRGITAYAQVNVAYVDYLRGALAAGRAALIAALDAAGNVRQVRVFADAVGMALGFALDDAELVARCGSLESLEVAFRSGEAGWFGPLAACHAERLCEEGRNDEGQALLTRALDAMDSAVNNYATLVAVARIGALEDVERAQQLCDEAAKRYDHTAARMYRSLFLAHRARRRRDRKAVSREAAHALTAARAIGAQTLVASALALAGETEAARALYTACGAAGAVRRLQSAPRAAVSGNALTRRELEIARLVARAHSNRDIGRQLCISERTVEHHVAAILGKLGLRSRVEIAAATILPGADS